MGCLIMYFGSTNSIPYPNAIDVQYSIYIMCVQQTKNYCPYTTRLIFW